MMVQPLLKQALEPAVRRRRNVRVLRVVALCWAVATIVIAAYWWSGKGSALTAPLVVMITGISALGLHRWAGRWEPDYHDIARTIEARHPELHALLLTAVEQRPDARTGTFHFLQQRVIQEAIAESRKHQWLDVVPRWQWAALVLLQVVLVSAFLYSAARLQSRFFHRSGPLATVPGKGVEISPGDVSIERGSGLVVLAKFQKDVPTEATLVLEPANGAPQRIPLVKNMEDPTFGAGLPEVNSDARYRVEYAGEVTRDFRITVFEHPRLERADARLRFPEYTKFPEKQLANTRRVSAVEGSRLDYQLELNKPVKSAVLVGKDGSEIPLRTEPGKPLARLTDFALQASQTYELRLEDAEGRASKAPAQIVFDVRPNRRPELKLIAPKGDQRVSSLQEVKFRTEAWDDFGMARYGLTYKVADEPEKELVFGTGTTPEQRVNGEHLLKLEEQGAEPDQLVSWFAWAEDTGPDGKLRRTATDMYFAEVRPFEQIFRPGTDDGSQQSSESGSAGEAERQAADQKQIISATWNLKRAEEATGSAKVSEKYQKDLPVIREAQEAALQKATALAAEAEQPRQQALIENVTKAMQSAIDQLKAAEKTAAPLPDALAAEQAAYNALLKLAAHEYQVVRRRGGGGGQGEQSSQRQLDQLEMKEEKNRYETKREAQPPQNSQQREQLAVLNRLKELAQRQQDVNEQLKELQTALQEAKTEQQKEEIRRQLKRLREEEQQLVADVDELSQKMEQGENQSRFAEERKQLEQTREQAQQATESMDRNEVSQALASGARAQQNLQQMRDEVRKKSSGQFREEMREMRNEARELAQAQEEINEKLRTPDLGAERRRTLDGSGPQEQLARELQEQQEALTKLRESMQQVSEQAEAAEPLLAKELYDTLRKNSQDDTDSTLQRARELTRRGLASQASPFTDKAEKEISELKSGVERAAESVLGDEAEALRSARSELDALREQLDREIAQANPRAGRNGQQDATQEPGNERSQQPGQRGSQGSPGEQARSDSAGEDSEQPGEGQSSRAGTAARQNASRPPRDSNRQTAQAGQSGSEQQGRDGAQGEGAEPSPDGESQQTAANGQQNGGNRPGQNGSPSQGRGQTAQAGQGEGQSQAQGESPGDSQGQAEGGSQGGSQGTAQAGRSQSGQGRGSSQNSGGRAQANAGGNNAGGELTPTAQEESRPGARLRELATGPRPRGGVRSGAAGDGDPFGGGAETAEGPLRGDGFVQWSDRLRNVEEMLDDSAMRQEVARVRELARGVRSEFKRHSEEPKWDLVKSQISAPLAQLRDRLAQELAKRESRESLVPIDRDPVPNRYSEHVRRYYEELGRSARD